jgi:predicted anti-sigma-YlaC factor YlaD
MGCEKIKELILEYPNGDLTQIERMQVETHLRECADCSLFLNGSHHVWNLMDMWDGVEVGETFVAKFWDRVSHEDTRKGGIIEFFRNWKLGWTYAGALVVIVIVSVILLNFFESGRTKVVFTEMDKADEKLLIDFDEAISREDEQSLDVYGPWDEPIEENNKGG